MTKDEVKKVIHFKNPAGVPLKTEDFAPTAFEKYGNKLWNLLKKYPSDFLIPVPDVAAGWKPAKEGEDEYGCVWDRTEGTWTTMVKEPLIKDWADFKNYKFPDPHAPGRLDYIKKCLRVPVDFYMVGGMWHGMFLRAQYLRGSDSLLEDLHLDKKNAGCLLDRIVEVHIGLIEEWAETGADCIHYADELGTTTSLMLSPTLFKEMLKPGYKEMFDSAHKRGMDVWFHTCGHIEPLIPELIECGVDILHNIEEGCNDRKRIAREYSGSVCFSTAPSNHTTLRYGTPGEVENETRWLIENLGTSQGGFIVCDESTIFPEISLENIEAMFRTAREYRY